MKKLLIILFLIMFIITSIQIINSYALYKNELIGNYNNQLGVWLINIDGQDISSGSEQIEFDMPSEYINFSDTEYVAPGKIAPGREGYMDLLIDATKTDVSVKYDITLNNPEDLILKVTRVENFFKLATDNDESQYIENDNFVQDLDKKRYMGVMPYSRIQEKYLNLVRIYFEWQNFNARNEFDTNIGSKEEENKFSVPVKVILTQYTGEEISI